MSYNKVMLIGKVKNEPTITHSKSGNTIASFNLMTWASTKNKHTDEWDKEWEYHDITCFGYTANTVEKYIGDGSRVFVEGSIKTDKWEGNDGKTNYRKKIYASKVVSMAQKGETSVIEGHPGENGQKFSSNPNDDLPF